MHRLLILIFIFCITNYSAQTFKQIDSFSNSIGATFKQFEYNNKMLPKEKGKRFGLESRYYLLKDFSLMVSEIKEGEVGEMYYLLNDSKDSSEKWYDIVKDMNNNTDYEFISSYIADPSDKITTDKLNYKDLIDLLRESTNTDNFIFDVKYKKGDIYIKVAYFASSISIIQSSKPIK